MSETPYEDPTPEDLDEQIEQLQRARKEARDQLATQRKAQLVEDLGAIQALETEFGIANIATLETNYMPGIPALVAVRTPKEQENKRYLATIKPEYQDGEPALGDFNRAFRELGDLCLVYPAKGTELRAALVKHRPPALLEAGARAVKLGESRKEAEGKG